MEMIAFGCLAVWSTPLKLSIVLSGCGQQHPIADLTSDPCLLNK